jgi:hypothetical protein
MAVDTNRLNKKIKELQKRYPESVYAIEEKKGSSGTTEVNIVRKSGRNPHKTKQQQKEQRQKKAEEKKD